MPDPTPGQLVVFSLGDEEYALPISCVHEIIRYAAPRSVASSDPSVRGVISLRGKIIPVFDLASRLGLEREPAEQAKIVIVETFAEDGSSLAGVVVDDVTEVLTMTGAELDADGGRAVSGSAIEAIAHIGDRLVALLDATQIVAVRTEAADAETPERLDAAAVAAA